MLAPSNVTFSAATDTTGKVTWQAQGEEKVCFFKVKLHRVDTGEEWLIDALTRRPSNDSMRCRFPYNDAKSCVVEGIGKGRFNVTVQLGGREGWSIYSEPSNTLSFKETLPEAPSLPTLAPRSDRIGVLVLPPAREDISGVLLSVRTIDRNTHKPGEWVPIDGITHMPGEWGGNGFDTQWVGRVIHVNGLSKSEDYELRASVCNKVGWSPYSPSLRFCFTPFQLPPPGKPVVLPGKNKVEVLFSVFDNYTNHPKLQTEVVVIEHESMLFIRTVKQVTIPTMDTRLVKTMNKAQIRSVELDNIFSDARLVVRLRSSTKFGWSDFSEWSESFFVDDVEEKDEKNENPQKRVKRMFTQYEIRRCPESRAA